MRILPNIKLYSIYKYSNNSDSAKKTLVYENLIKSDMEHILDKIRQSKFSHLYFAKSQ